MTAWWAQTRAEVTMTFRRGETLLLTVGIPIALLVFFTETHVITISVGTRVNVVTPGVLALCVMSTAFVSLSIATGFERSYGVLRRLFVTPLGRTRFLLAKVCATLVVEAVQVLIIGGVAASLGWRPQGGVGGAAIIVSAILLATSAFAGIGLALAGLIRAEANLAASNGFYVVLLLVSGFVIPTSDLPHTLANMVTALPSGALASVLHRVLGHGLDLGTSNLISLLAWAVGAPAVASRTFRFGQSR